MVSDGFRLGIFVAESGLRPDAGLQSNSVSPSCSVLRLDPGVPCSVQTNVNCAEEPMQRTGKPRFVIRPGLVDMEALNKPGATDEALQISVHVRINPHCHSLLCFEYSVAMMQCICVHDFNR